VFSEDWSSAKLISRVQQGASSQLCTFELSDQSKPLGLSTCACILAKGPEHDGTPVVRPYTPISTNALVGQFELLVKVYPDGKMSQHLATLPLGQPVDFKHIEFNVKIQYPFNNAKKIGILCGGTGVAPMIQALHAILGTPGDTSQVSMLYGSVNESDVLAKDTLDSWVASSGGRFSVSHVLSQEPTESAWTGARGFIDESLIKANLPSPSDDCLIFVCGPPPMYDTLCGPRTEKELTGVLAGMGFKPEQVYKF